MVPFQGFISHFQIKKGYRGKFESNMGLLCGITTKNSGKRFMAGDNLRKVIIIRRILTLIDKEIYINGYFTA